MRRLALLVGINAYANSSGFPELDYAEKDAEDMAAFLEEACGFQTVCLTGEAATREGILKALAPDRSPWSAKLSAADQFLLFFAGHGEMAGGCYVLHPYDARRGRATNSISMRDLSDTLRNDLPCRECMCVLDACRNLPAAGARGTLGQRAARDVACVVTATGSKMVEVMFGCREGEMSWEDPRLEQGVLTHHLRKAFEHESMGRVKSFETWANRTGDLMRSWRHWDVTSARQEPYLYKPRTERVILLSQPQEEEEIPQTAKVASSPPSASPVPPASPQALPAGCHEEARRVSVATPEGDEERTIVYFKNTLGMEFAPIPAGQFFMGDWLPPERVDKLWPAGKVEWYRRSHPRHRVRITRDFRMGVAPVTRAHFEAFVLATLYETDAEREGKARTWSGTLWEDQSGVYWRRPGFDQTVDHPVVCVSWNDAKSFCQWLTQKEGVQYRLPTEAEWEYGARAGSTTHWYWGDREEGAQGRANIASEDDGFKYSFKGVRDGYTCTSPAGVLQPNAFGLCDMIGNVLEWCEDWYGEEYYARSPEEDPPGPESGESRVLRGGSWYGDPRDSRTAYRSWLAPVDRHSDVGFRVVACLSR